MPKPQAIDEPKPIKVDMTYLCPKDPNRAKILAQNGVVLPEDGPTHLSGWITKIEIVSEKRLTYTPDGRQVEFEVQHKTATWTCQQDGSEIHIDPYIT